MSEFPNIVKVVEKPLFVKKRHELEPLLAKIKRGSEEAVNLLIDTMNADDPTQGVPLKVRLECANELLKLEVSITSKIAHDQIVRQIAELKAKGYRPGGSTEDDEKQLAPVTDFSTIQFVG